jgi:hypothetical protein
VKGRKMAFSDFRNYDEVAIKYGLNVVRKFFVESDGPVPPIEDYFRRDIAFICDSFGYQRSEAAAAESLIFPILKEVWKPYSDVLTLLSHEPLQYDQELKGIADYVVCKRSPHGMGLPDTPFLLVGEAKNDEFYRGWGQALSTMVAVRNRDGDLAQTIFGIATNGRLWEFGKLEDNTFTLENDLFTPNHLDALMGALHFVFAACREQVLKLPAPPAAA